MFAGRYRRYLFADVNYKYLIRIYNGGHELRPRKDIAELVDYHLPPVYQDFPIIPSLTSNRKSKYN